ncbi:MAG: tryptophan--tRNA ligase [Patescibacteria group bacterium]
MNKKIVFSGVQPSGNLHIGNYIGAVKQWVAGQEDGLNIFCLVDLHAITVPQDPKVLREKTLELAALLVASGLDPEKVVLFVQSHNPDHANLGWIMNCMIPMGQMSRMTQFKEKAEGKESVSVGLFDYPALMAADILIYDTTEVPIGEDQKQHVELARDTAEKFNSKFGETFVLPKPVVPKIGGRVMSLIDPLKKMSKSDANPMGAIGLLDTPEQVAKKIAGAVTDSERTIKYDPARPGVYNLVEIFAQMGDVSPQEVEAKFEGKGYKEFKEELTYIVSEKLVDLQKRYYELREGNKLIDILKTGAKKAYELSHPKLLEVYEKVGFVAA